MPASVVSLVYVILTLLEVARSELGCPLLRIEALLLRRLEVLLLVFIVVVLPIGSDNALQLFWVVVIHTDIVN